MKNLKQKTKKVLAGITVAVLGVALLGIGSAIGYNSVEKVDVEQLKADAFQSGFDSVEMPKPIIEYVDVEVPVEVPFQVEVDNGYLESVMDWLQEEYDEDIDVDYILFEVDAKMSAEAWIRSNLVEFLQDEDYFDDGELFEDYRRSEISVKKIYDAEINDRDYDDHDLDLSYEVKLRAKEAGEDREYFMFNVSIPFVDGNLESEDIDVELIE